MIGGNDGVEVFLGVIVFGKVIGVYVNVCGYLLSFVVGGFRSRVWRRYGLSVFRFEFG